MRGLQIDGGPIGSNSLSGIRFVAGKTLIVQHCSIRNFTGGSPNGYGINFNPSAGEANLIVDDTTLVTNGQPGGFGGGIFIGPSGAPTSKSRSATPRLPATASASAWIRPA